MYKGKKRDPHALYVSYTVHYTTVYTHTHVILKYKKVADLKLNKESRNQNSYYSKKKKKNPNFIKTIQ